MKITVDTNILVSATFWKGSSEKIIEKVEKKEIELVLSEDILDEFKRVLEYKEIRDKVKEKKLEMNRTIEKIIEIALFVEPKRKVCVVKEDPDDNIILECAKEGKVDYIITNDKHLLSIKEFEGIKIISSETFFNIIN